MKTESIPLSGESFGDLVLLRCVGKGSHGEVWLARAATGVLRAVKIVRRAAFSDPRPFEREFEGLQHFEPVSREHVGLMDILHIGRDESQECFYCVLELADPQEAVLGQPIHPNDYVPRTLHTLLRLSGRMPVADVIQLGITLADAVAFLHSRNLVHRDLKPSNIIFCQGSPKLADVGLVTTRDSTRSFVGTTGYVPMEGPGTEFADIYALGKVLHQAATLMEAESYPELPVTAQSWPDWSKFLELNSLIDRACSPKPSRRYASAAELKSDLEELAQGHSLRRSRRLRGYLRAMAVGVFLASVTLMLFRLGVRKEVPVDSFRNGLNTNRWTPFLTRPYSRLTVQNDGIELESRGGIDSRFTLPKDFEVSTQFRFLTQDDHLRICLRTDLKPSDPEMGRDGNIVAISQSGEVMMALPWSMIAATQSPNKGPFALGALQTIRIVCRSNHFEFFMGDAVAPSLSGDSTYSTGNSLTLYNRELPHMRLKMVSVAIRDLTRN